MQTVAYVSDEFDSALSGVAAEFVPAAGSPATVLHSSPSGAIYGSLAPGRYRVTLALRGYGSKWVDCELGPDRPHRWRLLSDGMLGYAWPKWVRAGESSELRMHAAEEFTLTLWRYGLRKEFVRTIGCFDEHGPRANLQILPDGDFTQSGVAWNRTGYPSVPITHLAVAPARSGLYYFWMRARDGRSFSFPWVVAPVKPSAAIAVLASTNTWNAYNNFGGRSNYINPAGLPPRPSVNARQDLSRYVPPAEVWSPADHDFQPLTFDRPEPFNHIFDSSPWDATGITGPSGGRVQSGLAPGEWRLLGWLEQEGFSYDYYADAQLHDGTLPLDAYRVLILTVHPEYWSRAMFVRVKEWVRERGGRLAYLGGNGLNCEVVLERDTMRCVSHVNSFRYGLGGSDDADPSRRYESRMQRTFEPEASMLGVATTDVGLMTAAPYRVLRAGHWAFDGTGLADGETFGHTTLHERVPGGASGHETDIITPSSPPNLEHLAKGENPNQGGADLVYYRHPSGGEVFSAGSMTWIPALFTDGAVARITRNVLARWTAAE